MGNAKEYQKYRDYYKQKSHKERQKDKELRRIYNEYNIQMPFSAFKRLIKEKGSYSSFLESRHGNSIW